MYDASSVACARTSAPYSLVRRRRFGAHVWLLLCVAVLSLANSEVSAAPIDDLQRLLARYELELKGEAFADSEQTARQMLVIGERNFATNDTLLARIVGLLAASCSKQKKYQEAQPYYERAVKLRERSAGVDSLDVAVTLHKLADCQWNQRRYDLAIKGYNRALAIRQRKLGAKHADTMESRDAVAKCEEKLNAAADTPTLVAALERKMQELGANHPDLLASMSNLASRYKHEGNAKEEAAILARAIMILEKASGERHPRAAQIFRQAARWQVRLEHYPEAERLWTRAIAAAEHSSEGKNKALIYAQEGLGNLYLDMGRLADAEQQIKAVLALRERIHGADHVEVAFSLGALANVYATAGRWVEAETLYKRCLALREKHEAADAPSIATALNNLGSLYSSLDRYAEAEPMLRRALAIREQAYGPENLKVAESLSNLGAAIRAQGRNDDAVLLYRRALAIREKLLGPDHLELTATLTNLGNYHLHVGEFDEADRLYQRASAIQVRVLGINHPDVAETLNKMANLAFHRKDYDKAETMYQQALASLEQSYGHDHALVTRCLVGLARVHFARKRYAAAATLADRAVAIRDRTGAGASDRYDSYFLRAKINWQQDRRSEALSDVRMAMDLAEQQRGLSSGAELERAQYFSRFSQAFERMVAWQVELGDMNEAFDAIERARARSLLDELSLPGVDLQVGRTAIEREQLRQHETTLRTKIATLEAQSRETSRPGAETAQHEEVEQKLVAARRALYEHYRDARSSSPVYRQLLATGSNRVRISQIQRTLLGDTDLLVEYLFGDRGGYLLLIQRDAARLVVLNVAKQEAATLGIESGPLTSDRLKRALMNEAGTGVLQQLADPKQAEQATPKLAALWRTLLPDAERTALTAGKHQRLIVVPDGPLALLPFDTLVVEEGSAPKFLLDVGPPLQYIPSATVLANLQDRAVTRGPEGVEPVLTVGDPAFRRPTNKTAADGDERAAAGGGSRASRLLTDQLPRLPHAALESQWVADVFARARLSSVKLTDVEATEKRVRTSAANRRIVHLACHGMTDKEHGNFYGALVLAPGPDALTDPADDGLLTLTEIYELDLHRCELAILSACETNFGPEQQGEGVWALSRGFLVAGSKRVVASNWLVDDEATASLVSHFCGGLTPGKTSGDPDYAKALHAAKRWVRQQSKWRSPYYWAPLVLVGPR